MMCPSPQTLARFAEGRLPRKDLAAVLAHIDTCDDCMSIVELANQTVAEEEELEAEPRRTGWWLGVAAAALIAIAGGWLLRERLARPGMGRLVALVPAGERLVEPRLSGGFDYAVYRGARRAAGSAAGDDAERMKLIGAAGEAVERARRDSSAEAQHTAGVARLLIDEPAEAVSALRIAV